MELANLIAGRFSDIAAERNFSFRVHTTIGCGGTAAIALSPASAERAAELICYLEGEKIPYCFLGAGANVLPSDGFFEGVVIRFELLNALYAEENVIYAGAGVTGGRLCRFARGRGLSGLEPFTGIPMSVGGAAAMNAGVAEGHVSDLAVRVFAAEKGKLKTLEARECAFGVKNSIFLQEKIAVLGVYLKTAYASEEQIARNTCYFRNKRAHLPKGRSMGCVFVNPQEISAGKLIEECGLKGAAVGGARVSEEHANFIINEKNATFADVSRLAAFVKDTVHRKTGILLREEIRPIP